MTASDIDESGAPGVGESLVASRYGGVSVDLVERIFQTAIAAEAISRPTPRGHRKPANGMTLPGYSIRSNRLQHPVTSHSGEVIGPEQLSRHLTGLRTSTASPATASAIDTAEILPLGATSN